MRRTRSMLVVVLVGVMAGIVSPPPAAAATLQKIKMTQPTHGLSFLPLYVARANRYFEAEGLDVETIVTGGDGPDVQALLARNVDFAASNPKHLYTTYLEGKPLLAVATLLGRCSINLVIHRDVARARGITETTPLAAKLKALKGLTIGATRPGALTYHLALYYIKRAGYEPQRDVQVIGAGAGPVLLAALENRKVDIMATSTPDPEQAVARGYGMMFINNAAGEDPELGEFLQAVLYVRPEDAKDRPDLVRRMVRAVVRANTWIARQPPEQIAQAIQPFFGKIDAPVLLASVRTMKSGVVPDGRLSEKGSAAYQEVLLATGGLTRKVPFEAVFTNSFLPGTGGR